jgi:hypothetical protein
VGGPGHAISRVIRITILVVMPAFAGMTTKNSTELSPDSGEPLLA